MLSAAQRENIAVTFDALDATADGVLTRDDVVLRAEQLCTGLGLDAASQAHREIHSAYRQCWGELLRFADSDEDGAVTLEEFGDAVDRGMLEDPQFVDSAMLVISHACFSAVDADGDGVIDRDEYSRIFTAVDPSKADLASAGFDILDRDGDGLVSRDELIDAMRQLFVNTEAPEAFGRRVLR
jgi:Ca2+-binding EF-hand superfamily protein